MMSTTPVTSSKADSSYTVIGETRRVIDQNSLPVSVVILNRGERIYKENQFLELENAGFAEVISVEPPNSFYDVETYARRFKKMKFVVPKKNLSPGEYINIAASEASAPLLLVIWNNMHLPLASYSKKIIIRAIEEGNICTVPFLYSRRNDPLPTIHQPALYKRKRLKMVSCQPSQSHLYTLAAHDYCGFYNRKILIESGGFDSNFTEPWWQLMDFGLRSYMWGNRIHCDLTFRMNYQQEVKPLDQSVTVDYAFFYLKNLAIRFKKDKAYLPGRRYFTFRRQIGGSSTGSWKKFMAIKHWISSNRFRYIQDATKVAHLWEKMQ